MRNDTISQLYSLELNLKYHNALFTIYFISIKLSIYIVHLV